MKIYIKGIKLIPLALLFWLPFVFNSPARVNAMPQNNFALSQCGYGKGSSIETSIDFGCKGAACFANNTLDGSTSNPYCSGTHNAVIDLIFAVIRFISDGVGLIIIASVIIAGVQYTFSRGEPQSLNAATKRIQSAFTALVIFIFAYAILNYVIPNGFLGQ